MTPQSIRLFVKPGCPWCEEAIDWLDSHSLTYTTHDVTDDEDARNEMYDLSGQTKAPVIEVDDHVLSDFGADELEAWWEKKRFD